VVLPDGNGRTGRLLINYELLKNGLPPIVIPTEKRGIYFDYIATYNEEQLKQMFSELLEFEMKRIEKFKDMKF